MLSVRWRMYRQFIVVYVKDLLISTVNNMTVTKSITFCYYFVNLIKTFFAETKSPHKLVNRRRVLINLLHDPIWV